ncbi:MAG: recombination protein RecR [Deltaproteobacteria bacterium]|nr:recombination protein RecR [Deltaproteobacteria bacterium]
MRRLVNELTKLPTIGEKSAVRLAYHLLSHDPSQALELSEAIKEARLIVRECERCFGLSEEPLCEICCDQARTRSIVCVVEKPADLIAIERSMGYRGLFHVLHGLWSPLRGVNPEKTRIRELFDRIERTHADSDSSERIEEIVLATGTTVEGDATALYIANSVKHFPVRISRIAQGLPKGGELEYADEMTLSHALEGRRRM